MALKALMSTMTNAIGLASREEPEPATHAAGYLRGSGPNRRPVIVLLLGIESCCDAKSA